jgi:hypothetical protein
MNGSLLNTTVASASDRDHMHTGTNGPGGAPTVPTTTTVPNQVAMPSSGSNATGPSGTPSKAVLQFERANFKDSIMIHVIDDSKNEKRNFTFSRSLLVRYMKYFDRCLKKISDNEEIDISIHCDAEIFEWLLSYIFSVEEYEKKKNSNNIEAEKFNRAVANSVNINKNRGK